MADVPPYVPSDIPILVFHAPNRVTRNIDFKVCWQVVLWALILLKQKQQVIRKHYYWYKSCWTAARRGLLTSASINTDTPVRADEYGLEEDQGSKSSIEKSFFCQFLLINKQQILMEW